jgi:hypothetical protein
MFWKFIGVTSWLLKMFDFDYLIRVNSSAYLNLDKLEELLKKGVEYAGPESNKNFAPGWFVVLSRATALKLVEFTGKQKRLKIENDDAMIGKILNRMDIPLTKIPFVTFGSITGHAGKIDHREIIAIRIKHHGKDRITSDAEAFKAIDSLYRNDGV